MKMVDGSSAKLPGLSEGRGSKRLITDTRANVLVTSSANAVMSNEDLLIKILLLLPAFSLLLHKSVSKQWLSVIACPTFTLRHSQTSNIDPPSGLFVWGPKRKLKLKSKSKSKGKGKSKSKSKSKSKRNKFECSFISFDIRVPSKIFAFGSKAPDKILQSCNGLLLCYIEPNKFFVYNPCVNLFKMLPQPHMSNLKSSSFIGGIRLVFNPKESPYYKVVHAQYVADDDGADYCIQIETYSSETCNWSVCANRIPAYQNFVGFENGIHWKGAIHWLGYDVYDVHGPSSNFKMDILVDHPVLETIELPVMLDGSLCWNGKFFESRGCLLLACTGYSESCQLHIFEMTNEYSGWSVKYLVNLDDLSESWGINLTDFMMRSLESWVFKSGVWCIVLGEREEDSFMVIQSHGKVLQYKIMLNTVHTLFDFGSTSSRESFPFIASFAGV